MCYYRLYEKWGMLLSILFVQRVVKCVRRKNKSNTHLQNARYACMQAPNVEQYQSVTQFPCNTKGTMIRLYTLISVAWIVTKVETSKIQWKEDNNRENLTICITALPLALAVNSNYANILFFRSWYWTLKASKKLRCEKFSIQILLKNIYIFWLDFYLGWTKNPPAKMRI